jgi:hypothetical protein
LFETLLRIEVILMLHALASLTFVQLTDVMALAEVLTFGRYQRPVFYPCQSVVLAACYVGKYPNEHEKLKWGRFFPCSILIYNRDRIIRYGVNLITRVPQVPVWSS